MAIFDEAEVDLPCPGCGHEHKKTLGWFQDQPGMACEGCGEFIAFEHADLKSEMKGLDDAWNSVLQAFDKK